MSERLNLLEPKRLIASYINQEEQAIATYRATQIIVGEPLLNAIDSAVGGRRPARTPGRVQLRSKNSRSIGLRREGFKWYPLHCGRSRMCCMFDLNCRNALFNVDIEF